MRLKWVWAVLTGAAIQAAAADGTVNTNGLFATRAEARIEILHAHVFSENNPNTDFEVRVETQSEIDPQSNPVELRVGRHRYAPRGWGGHFLEFDVPSEDEARAAAQWLGVECTVRAPPGYKLLAQFFPGKPVYAVNEPVSAKFEVKNLDDRLVIFLQGGQQRGARDNQYGFRAMVTGARPKPGHAVRLMEPAPDIGDPVNFGGLATLVELKPGKTFEDDVDLKKWFAFDRPGHYAIHGFYDVTFYRPASREDSYMPWTELWHDYIAADFVVEVK